MLGRYLAGCGAVQRAEWNLLLDRSASAVRRTGFLKLSRNPSHLVAGTGRTLGLLGPGLLGLKKQLQLVLVWEKCLCLLSACPNLADN